VEWIGSNWLWVALGAWVLTFAAMLVNVWTGLFGERRQPAEATT
jgi:hypothetical protein